MWNHWHVNYVKYRNWWITRKICVKCVSFQVIRSFFYHWYCSIFECAYLNRLDNMIVIHECFFDYFEAFPSFEFKRFTFFVGGVFIPFVWLLKMLHNGWYNAIICGICETYWAENVLWMCPCVGKRFTSLNCTIAWLKQYFLHRWKTCVFSNKYHIVEDGKTVLKLLVFRLIIKAHKMCVCVCFLATKI